MPTQNRIITPERVAAQQAVLAELTKTKDALLELVPALGDSPIFTAIVGLYGAMCILTQEYGDLLVELDR